MSILVPLITLLSAYFGFKLGDKAVERFVGYPEKGCARAAVYTQETEDTENKHRKVFIAFACLVTGLWLTTLFLKEEHQPYALGTVVGLGAGLEIARQLTQRRI